jgi:peroxiredoxin family protein
LKEKKRSLDEQIKKMKKKMSQDQAKIEACCGEMDIHAYHDEQKHHLQHHTVSQTVVSRAFCYVASH